MKKTQHLSQPASFSKIDVLLKHCDGGEVLFKLSQSTQMQKVFHRYTERTGKLKCNFVFNGSRLLQGNTPKGLGMRTGQTVHVTDRRSHLYANSTTAAYIKHSESIIMFNDGEILQFSLNEKEWSKIIFNKISGPRICSYDINQIIISSNQKYAIMIGPKGASTFSMTGNKFKHVRTLEFIDCDGNLIEFEGYAVSMNGIGSKNDILVHGYVKDIFKEQEFQTIQLPPTYLMNVIRDFHSAEIIHFFEEKMHYGVYLRDLIMLGFV